MVPAFDTARTDKVTMDPPHVAAPRPSSAYKALSVLPVTSMGPFQVIGYVVNQVIRSHRVHTVKTVLTARQFGVHYRLL